MKRVTIRCGAALVLLLLSLPVLVHSQPPGDPPQGNLPGRHSVAGMIFTPNRTPASRGIRVRLSKGTNDYNAWTDQDGKFIIVGVGNGTYTLSAEPGDDFEPASQRLEIALPRNAPAQTFTVDIQLRWKPNARPKPGVIDAGLASVPQKAMEYYEKAGTAAKNGDHQGAVEDLLRAVAEYPDFATAHAELGVQYQKLNQLEKSDQHLQTALRLKPGLYQPLANRGIVLVRMKKYDEAELVLREALKIKDDSAVIHFYLGRSLVGQNRPVEAEPAFRTALRMGGNDMLAAHRALANIYIQRGEETKALSELEAYLAANPKPADEKELRGIIQQIKDRLKEKGTP